MQIADKYSPQEIESKWYDYWMEHRLFHSEPDEREPYTIVIPPPNVTGMLHMGHMLNNTLQDVLVRRARMQGKNACWVPGTDHASIAINQPLFIEVAEDPQDAFGTGFVHREAGALPVARGAQLAQLLQDHAAVFLFPVPGMTQELFARERRFLDPLGLEFGHHLGFRGKRSSAIRPSASIPTTNATPGCPKTPGSSSRWWAGRCP